MLDLGLLFPKTSTATGCLQRSCLSLNYEVAEQINLQNDRVRLFLGYSYKDGVFRDFFVKLMNV